MNRRPLISLLLCLALGGCAASSQVQTNACPAGYKPYQNYCLPV